jgi:mono/diheme cytochrome c family protein
MSEGVFAVVGLFDSPDALLAAIPPLRERRLGRLEAYTPYPVHGLSAALGARRSPLGGMVLVMGALGALSALAFQWWANGIDYPTVTGGKALGSWEAFVPILFEVTVLFATFTAGFGMLVLLNRLPFFGHALLSSPVMAAVTRDRLALAVESPTGDLDQAAAEAALLAAGALSVTVVPVAQPTAPTPARTLRRMLVAILAACLLSGTLTYWAVKLFPVLHPMAWMLDQPRADAQRPSAFFADGRVDQLPAPGSVARGHLPYRVTTPAEADLVANPLPRTREVLARGRFVFRTYCAVCHGPLATGEGSLTSAYGAKPANLQAVTIRAYSDGRIHDVILRGKNSMPSYAAVLSEDERWSAIHYLRALHRAQHATDEDLR